MWVGTGYVWVGGWWVRGWGGVGWGGVGGGGVGWARLLAGVEVDEQRGVAVEAVGAGQRRREPVLVRHEQLPLLVPRDLAGRWGLGYPLRISPSFERRSNLGMRVKIERA